MEDPGPPPVLTGNREAIERALRHHEIWASMANGRWWRCYLIGKGIGQFPIPISIGYSTYGVRAQITETDRVAYVWDKYAYTAFFVWCLDNPLIYLGLARP